VPGFRRGNEAGRTVQGRGGGAQGEQNAKEKGTRVELRKETDLQGVPFFSQHSGGSCRYRWQRKKEGAAAGGGEKK